MEAIGLRGDLEGRQAPALRPVDSAELLTTAELAECTCPEPCERDHDRD